MPGLDEASRADTPIGSDLAEGVKAISINQTITFSLYREAILPLDGYRFWVKANPPQITSALGSLHYASDIHQDEAESYSLNRVIFTSLKDVKAFNTVAPNQIWIGEFEGMMFSFSQRGSYYRQTDMFHYIGNAVYPDMQTQVVKSAGQLETGRVIASNSMPLWLELNEFGLPNPPIFFTMPCRIYPGLLLPLNLTPPFASVDILPGGTRALQSTPHLNGTDSHFQLVSDRVKITMHGLRNDDAMNLYDAILQYSLLYDRIGIMNETAMIDEKRTQAELLTIAQKKSIDFEVSYYQFTARNVAKQLITKVINNFFPQDV